MSRTSAHRIAVALTGAVVAFAALTLALAVVLSFEYRPSAAQAWSDAFFGGGGSGWTEWHRVSAILWALAALGSVVSLGVLVVTGNSRRPTAVALGTMVVVGVAASVALATRDLVQWDQLALWAVTSGGDLDGYWSVFGDDVRFVLVDAFEVDPGDYGVALAVHLLAHVVGAVTAVGSLVVLGKPDAASIEV